MNSLVALALFAFLAIDFCIPAPSGPRPSLLFRRRRQANMSDVFSADFFCALQCSVDHSSAWSMMSNFKAPTAKAIPTNLLSGFTASGSAVFNDTFNNLCLIEKSYSNCLRSCPNGVLNNNMRQGVTALSVLCDPSKTDLVSQTPCLYNNNKAIQDSCKGTTNDLVAASKALQDLHQSNGVNYLTGALPSIRQLCSSADKQARCVLPAVQQYCGNQASILLQAILNESLANLRQIAGDNMNLLSSPECTAFFHTMENGSWCRFQTR